jgi:DNA-binding NtrC family response regulator
MPRFSILIVDDNVTLAGAYQSALEECGFHVTTATSGEEALARSDEDSSTVALVDLRLPQMDGADTMLALRQRRPLMKFIAMSGQLLSPYFSRLADMGVRDFLPKPFSLDALIGSIQAAERSSSVSLEPYSQSRAWAA